MTGKKTLTTLTAVALLALALTGCSSDNDTTSPLTTVDTAPPAVPAQIEGYVHDSSVLVEWAPNMTDADLAGYKVYRMAGDRAVSMTSDPVATNSYMDERAPEGSVEYRVTALDVSGNESASQVGVSVNLGLGGPHPALPLETGDSAVRQRTGEPVARGERLARVENRRDFGNDGQSEIASAKNRRRRAQRPSDLQSEHLAVAFARAHEPRIQSLTSVQKSDSPTSSSIITDSAAARSSLAPVSRRRPQMSSAIVSLVASSVRASAKS